MVNPAAGRVIRNTDGVQSQTQVGIYPRDEDLAIYTNMIMVMVDMCFICQCRRKNLQSFYS